MSRKIKSENTNFFYDYKTDLAEINRFNYHLILKNYFHLTTKKITLMAMILALNLVVTIFSKYVLGLVPVAGFFVMEISFFTILLFTIMNNFIYSLIFLELTIWFRVILGSEPIGLLAMNLSDGFFLILFCFVVFCFKRLAIKRQWEDWCNKLFIYQWFFVASLTVLTSAFAVLINYSFLLELYFPNWTKKEIVTLLPIIFGLNIAKYTLNSILYFSVFKPTTVLARHYQA